MMLKATLKTAAIAATNTILQKLNQLGIHTPFDLVTHKPLRYENETTIHSIQSAVYGQHLLVEGIVQQSSVLYRPRRQLVVKIADKTGFLMLRFMHFYPSLQQSLKVGKTIRALGEIKQGFLGKEMIHPRLRSLASLPKTLTPIYPTVKNLSQETLYRLINEALKNTSLDDTLPRSLLKALNLPSFEAAIKALHHPLPLSNIELALKRLKWDELLAQQLLGILNRQKREHNQAIRIMGSGTLSEKLLKHLPFALTPDQQAVLLDIKADLAKNKPMLRLLQGEVGSGKTIVAALAALSAIEAGLQVAMMVPTEILAEQHFFKFQEWFEPLGVIVLSITAHLTRQERKVAMATISQEKPCFVIGTHALFQDKVVFGALGLVIIDEQHRFGVVQRLAFKNKGHNVHQLMMSATPIPRTLAMHAFADMDISSIHALPPNRQPILTKLIDIKRRASVEALVKKTGQRGTQVYWVCPLIEESEALLLKTANETYESLCQSLKPLKVGLLHSKMTREQKKGVMEQFVKGQLQILVATTIIEVGVDVANANLMVIDHAERMGLAQLHQLRGRIGRGIDKGTCILLFQTPLSVAAKSRLKVIYENQDGFKIAEEDLAIRGFGEVLGQKQSGLAFFKFAQLPKDQELLEATKKVADTLLATKPKIVQAHLKRWSAGKAQYLET